jgi:hypothetical protein
VTRLLFDRIGFFPRKHAKFLLTREQKLAKGEKVTQTDFVLLRYTIEKTDHFFIAYTFVTFGKYGKLKWNKMIPLDSKIGYGTLKDSFYTM